MAAGPVGAGALGEAFWGLLFGTLLFVPLICAAVGPEPAGGPARDALAGTGIDPRFVATVRELEPGSSALFMISSEGVVDRVQDALADVPVTLIHTELSDDPHGAVRRPGNGTAPRVRRLRLRR